MTEKVAIVMGSASDHDTMQHARDVLTSFGIEVEYRVASAHRAPEVVSDLAKNAKRNGFGVIIAGAGGAAHLPGVVAAQTTLPVIGVPIQTSNLQGLDSLLSIAQMPGGVPVACMAIGKAGAKNAGLLAVAILAIRDQDISKKLDAYRAKQTTDSLSQPLPT